MKILQIGSGGWGKSWLEYINNNEGSELVGLISRGGENLEKAKEKYKLKDSQIFNDPVKGLKENADLVIITIPHPWHIEYAKMAVKAGKNVLIEKPLSNDFKKTKNFIDYLKERDEKVWVSQNFRFRRNLWKLKASLGEEGIGQIKWMDVLFRFGNTREKFAQDNAWQKTSWRSQQFSLLIQEIAIHHFDIMRFLLDSNAKRISCKGFNPYWNDLNGIECMFAGIEFNNDVYVNYSGSLKAIGLSTGWMGNYTVQTDKGAVQISESDIKLELGINEKGNLKEEIFFPGEDREGVLNELQKGISDKECAVPTIYDNIYSYAMVYAAELSIKENRPVEFNELF